MIAPKRRLTNHALHGREEWFKRIFRDQIAANPFMGDLLDVFENAVARPATPTGLKYPAASRAFWDATHEVLSGRVDGAAAVRRLEGRLLQTRRAKW